MNPSNPSSLERRKPALGGYGLYNSDSAHLTATSFDDQPETWQRLCDVLKRYMMKQYTPEAQANAVYARPSLTFSN